MLERKWDFAGHRCLDAWQTSSVDANYGAHASAAEVLIEIGSLRCDSAVYEWSNSREN